LHLYTWWWEQNEILKTCAPPLKAYTSINLPNSNHLYNTVVALSTVIVAPPSTLKVNAPPGCRCCIHSCRSFDDKK
jgi:hypothetical protein